MPTTTTFSIVITMVINQDYYTDSPKEIVVEGDVYTQEEITVEDMDAEVDSILFEHGLHEFPTVSIDYKVFNEKGEEVVF